MKYLIVGGAVITGYLAGSWLPLIFVEQRNGFEYYTSAGEELERWAPFVLGVGAGIAAYLVVQR